MARPLTFPTRSDLVFDYLRQYITAHGWAPTLREIGEAVGISSTSVVVWHLKRLQREGRIERGTGRQRAIRVLR